MFAYFTQVYREFKQVDDYRISDGECNVGEPNVEILYTDDVGSSESFELVSLSYLNKGIDLRNSSGCCNEFDKITRQLRDRVAKIGSEVHETSVQMQKECHAYMIQCQSINQNVSVLCKEAGKTRMTAAPGRLT